MLMVSLALALIERQRLRDSGVLSMMSCPPAHIVMEDALRTALECLLKAVHCELKAMTCADPTDRSMMLETAQRWRGLAKTAKPRHDDADVTSRAPARACGTTER